MSAAKRQLKLGAVTYGVGGPGSPYLWLDEDIPLDASVNINWYIEQARLAEAAKFDLIFIVDSQFITADSPPHYLNRLEPLTLLSALAVSTTHLGLVATMTTSYNDPFNIARRLASLELISGGRSGWNVVTSGDAGAASNFSRDEHYDYDTRYARGLEFVQVCQGLWDSYEEDAFPRDRATRAFLDPSKQHALRHKGDHFQVVGPLNVSRSPQGQPVIFQAGDSDQGRDLGATIGEGIFTHSPTIEQAQAFYTDLKGRAVAKGRDPDHIVIMPGAPVFVGDTDDEAREIEHDLQDQGQGLRPRPGRTRPPLRLARLPPVRPGRPVPARGPGLRGARLPHRRREDRQAGEGQRLHAPPDRRVHLGAAQDPVRRLPGHGRHPHPGVVRGPRPRRPQLQRGPPQPVAPLPRGGHPHPPGARHRPHGIRIDDAARQPGPPHPGKPLHKVKKSSSIPNVSSRGCGISRAAVLAHPNDRVVPLVPFATPATASATPDRPRRACP